MLRLWTSTLTALGLALALALVLGATPAIALTLGFDELAHGEIVGSYQNVIITTENFNDNGNHPDLAVAFDTTVTGSADEDLEKGLGWAGGNLAPGADFENILIIQENDDCTQSICSNPDDEGRRPAGRFTIDYSQLGSFRTFAFDLVDVDDANLENGSVEFFLGGVAGVEIAFADFLTLGQNVIFGDNFVNHIDMGDVGLFDKVEITMNGSGGIDNLTTNLTTVPEPNTLALLTLGLTAIGVVGRRT